MINGYTVVSPTWLLEHLDDPQVAIADCRFSLMEPELGRQQYAIGHLPGAVYFDLNRDLSSPVQRHGGRHPLPDFDTFAQTLAAAGIHSGDATRPPTLVVAYDDSRFAYAARFWWLLRYLGHPHVAVLDGGFRVWQEAGYPVTADLPSPTPGEFIPQIQSNWVVTIDEVKARKDQPGAVLVDSREGDRYRGEREPIDPIAGHIPGAVNYVWTDVTDAQGFALPVDQQRARWAALQTADDVMVYCGSGVTACVNLLSLELAGITNPKLYAGSWSDWCSYLVED
jgi:thiosulfate/3-mercaptopyruvate sulfurtransferase